MGLKVQTQASKIYAKYRSRLRVDYMEWAAPAKRQPIGGKALKNDKIQLQEVF